jgi:hypothetical protein
MSERILSSLLCALVGAMAVFLLGLLFAISSSEGDKFSAIVSMRIGGAGAILICGALIVACLIVRAPQKRPAAGQLRKRSRAQIRTEGVRRDQLLEVPSHELSHGLNALESDAGLFLLDERDPDTDLDTDRQADFEPPRPAPAFRALGRRVVGSSTGLPPEPGFTSLGTATEGNGSHGDSLRRVEGTNRKGRLCWICGKEHGPEIVHGTKSLACAVPEEWLATAYDSSIYGDP